MAYSLLRSMASPWPFPPGFRVLLVGLDEYHDWFGRGKRADLLALSLDTEERGVHCAAIEVKAVRSTDTVAAFREAKEQLRATIADGRFAVSPDKSLFSRMWLNRIAEAAIGVARESNFRLQADELDAIEEFRTNRALEWAGVGLIFGKSLPREEQHPRLRSWAIRFRSRCTASRSRRRSSSSGKPARRERCAAKPSSTRCRRARKSAVRITETRVKSPTMRRAEIRGRC